MRSVHLIESTEKTFHRYYRQFSMKPSSILCKKKTTEQTEVPNALGSNLSENEVSVIQIKSKRELS